MAVWNPRLQVYANIGGALADDIDPDGEPLQVTLVAPLANDTDADSDVLTVVLVAKPAHGTAAIVPLLNMVIYTPDPSWHGTDAFTYTVTDSTETATAMVRVTVTPANDPPVAVNDAYVGTEDSTLVVDASAGLLANDSGSGTCQAVLEITTLFGTSRHECG